MGRDLHQEGHDEWWLDHARWPGPHVEREYTFDENGEIRIQPTFSDIERSYAIGEYYWHPDTGAPVGIIVGIMQDPFMWIVKNNNGPE